MVIFDEKPQNLIVCLSNKERTPFIILTTKFVGQFDTSVYVSCEQTTSRFSQPLTINEFIFDAKEKTSAQYKQSKFDRINNHGKKAKPSKFFQRMKNRS